MRILRSGCLAAALLATATPVWAQEVTATLRGAVVDEEGQPIPGATVVIVHEPSGTRTTQTTDGAGSFSSTNLRIGGPFRVTVTAEGYASAEAEVLNLAAGQPTRIQVTLVQEAIVVTGTRRPSVIALATGPATVLTERDIEGVATINRDIRALAQRDPFVTLDPTNGTGAISIAGQNNRFNRITVDGIGFGDPFGLEAGGLASARGPVPLDAIGAFSVEIAPVDIQQGGFQGGAINTVLKSGTNKFGITGFYSYAADELAGDRILDRRVTRDFTSKIYGAQVTGPIIKDKLFFAVTWERIRNTTPADVGVPGEGFGNAINAITRAEVDQIRNIVQTVYGYDALDVARAVPETDDKVAAKIDWNIADGHRLALTYIYQKGDILAGQTGIAAVTATDPGLALQSNNYQQGTINHYGVAQLNNEWSDVFSTQLRISYNDYERLQVPFNGRTFGQFNVCTDPVSVGSLTACTTVTAGSTAGGRVLLGPDISRQANELFVKSFSAEAQAQIKKNDHNVKLIFERRSRDISNLFAQNVSGNFYFDSIADLQARRANALTFAAPNSGDIDSVRALFANIIYTLGIQDTWDVTPDLTVIAGMRYDLYQANRRPVFNPAFLERNGFANNETLNGRSIFQPRAGFNYSGVPGLRITGAAGLFAGGGPDVWISNSYSNPGPLLSINTIQRTATGYTGLAPFEGLTATQLGDLVMNNVSGGQGIPDIYRRFVTRALASLAVTNAIAPDFEIPSQWRLSLSLDYDLDLGALVGFGGDGWKLGADVIFSRVKNGITWTDLRSIDNGRLPDGRPRYRQRPNTLGAGGTSITDNAQDVLLFNSDQGYSWNASFQLDKRFDNGIYFGGSYTFQRAKDVNSGTSSVALSNYSNSASRDPNNAAYGISNYQYDSSWRIYLGYDAEIFKNAATRFEIYYNSRSGQRYSYTFQDPTAGRSAVFGTTGANNRYLLYVPNVASPTADPLVTYASGFDFTGFQSFVQEVLRREQGSIVGKNTGRSPRFNQVNVRVAQEIPFFFGSRIEGFVDVENFLNLLNKDWNALRQVGFPYYAPIVNVACNNGNTLANPCTQYIYSNFRRPNEALQTNLSLWQIRVGARFTF